MDQDRVVQPQSIEDVATLIRTREVSPVEVTEACLLRIEELQPRLNAFITVLADQAMAAAREAERSIAAGTHLGPLHGIPIGVKDLFETAGVRTTAGSAVLRDWVPDTDSEVVARLKRAGAVVIGKLNMTEFAYGTTNVNKHWGDVRNPWDTERVPGGSSGGSAVATVTGMALGALGSDTGGSIRIPASECGCVGLMPTYGRVSLRGAVPLSWSLDHAGPMTRTVRDAALMLQVLAGHDPADPASVYRPVPDYLADQETRPLRVGLPQDFFWDRAHGELADLCRRAVDALADAGCEVVQTRWPEADEYSWQVGPILSSEASAYHAEGFAQRPGDYGVGDQIENGYEVTGVEVAKAMRVLATARAGAADAALDGVDVLAVPTMQEEPPSIESVRAGDLPWRRTQFTSLLDLTGQPVLTVPCGLTSAGLPTGISFVARRWDEVTALRAGRTYELARGPFSSPPDHARFGLGARDG